MFRRRSQRLKVVRVVAKNKYYYDELSADNGRQFVGYEIIAKELEADQYLVHPYSSESVDMTRMRTVF